MLNQLHKLRRRTAAGLALMATLVSLNVGCNGQQESTPQQDQLSQRVEALAQDNEDLRRQVAQMRGELQQQQAPAQPPAPSLADSAQAQPTRISIAFTRVPPLRPEGDNEAGAVYPIAGTVTGVANPSDYRISVYTLGGTFYVQPFIGDELVELRPTGDPNDSSYTWESQSHLGTEYVAMLVSPDYEPPAQMTDLPNLGPDVFALESTNVPR